jgi:protein-disulfide isomerase
VIPGKVKMVFRDTSFLGPDSVVAGRAAVAAGYQNKLWSFVDAFYYQQGPENSGYVTSAFLRKVGATVPGLDVGRMMVDRQSAATVDQLNAAKRLALTGGVSGTPAFVIERSGSAPIRIIGSAGLAQAISSVVGR